MKAGMTTFLRAGATSVFLALLANPPAFAQVDHDQYLARLAKMQGFARIQKLKSESMLAAGVAAASRFSNLFSNRKFFEAGQRWAVEVWARELKGPRKAGLVAVSDSRHAAREQKPRVFEFVVRELAEGGLARLEVREKLLDGQSASDPRIEAIILTINPQFVITGKEVHYRDGRAPLALSLDGETNATVGFEAFPIEIPDLASVDGKVMTELPSDLQQKIRLENGHALEFHYADLLARPLRAFWADGDVWPAYVENASGVAILSSRSRVSGR